MDETILKFDKSFIQTLKEEVEKLLNTPVTIGQQFKSSDSFSFLITTDSQKFVAKIYRFRNWPPQGKLLKINELLDTHQIPHEKIIHVDYGHSVFKFGWQLSNYIIGETARKLRQNNLLNDEEYYIKIGKLLKRVHQIKFNYAGSFQNESKQFKIFNEFVKDEIEELDFTKLSNEYPWAEKILSQAKKTIFYLLKTLQSENSVLIHDDVNDSNVIWHQNEPILIDWTDSIAGPPLRDFAAMTFRQDNSILKFIEEGYGQTINPEELLLHQIIRFMKLSHFFYMEDGNIEELKLMMKRLENLLERKEPYGI